MNFFERIEEGKDKCIHNAPPPCAGACPLGIDVRAFIKNFKDGLISAAYKSFSIYAVMPGVVCHICPEPCKRQCVRKSIDESVSLRELERYCWQQSRTQPEKQYFRREKPQKVLVCGDDAQALAVAVKLARRNYPVDLAVHGHRLGGSLWQIPETVLPREVLEEDLNHILSERFLSVQWNAGTLEREKILSYDAAFLSSLDDCDDPEIQKQESVFLAEDLDSHLEMIRQGNLVSYQMEEYVKIKNIVRTKDMGQEEPYIPEIPEIAPQPAVVPKDRQNWTEEEAAAEAERCLECQCNRCAEVCPMMRHYSQADYNQLSTAIIDTVEAQQIDRKRGLYPLMSCLQCGACLRACPVQIDTKNLCAAARRLTRERKILPPSYYQYWLSDMEQADTEAEILLLPEKTPKYMYFPGCQMAASDPEYVAASYRWMQEQYGDRLALWIRCCGAPANWAGDSQLYERSLAQIRKTWKESQMPTFILSCPTCMERFRESLPEIKTVSLWELMADGLEQRPDTGEKIAVFDSCAAKSDENLKQAIRRIARKLGYEPLELSGNGRETSCCGYGGLVYSVNPEMVEEVRRCNAELDEHEFLTYCVNCTDSFRAEGKAAKHILNAVFQLESPAYTAGLERRRVNRMELKQQLLGKNNSDPESQGVQEMKITIPTEVKEKMDRQLLLEEDVCEIVASAQAGNTFVKMDNKQVAHKRIGYVTIWVEYHTDAETPVVDNVYSHRIVIKEA